ncbi:hypothetical protein [Microbacterium arborescens]|uniref:hypothetical protein n=1 Tax=Microbacterium arborescens TaxID=33883 RepID=UPI00278B7DDD|nr:hypothetical protein [Microbacterium arborescens]MDQ1217721.1 hypothetical protein [Microbacterium arborescens]
MMFPQSGVPDIKPQIPPIPGLIEALTGVATIAAGVAFIAVVLAALFAALGDYTPWAIQTGFVAYFPALITLLTCGFAWDWRPAITVLTCGCRTTRWCASTWIAG